MHTPGYGLLADDDDDEDDDDDDNDVGGDDFDDDYYYCYYCLKVQRSNHLAQQATSHYKTARICCSL